MKVPLHPHDALTKLMAEVGIVDEEVLLESLGSGGLGDVTWGQGLQEHEATHAHGHTASLGSMRKTTIRTEVTRRGSGMVESGVFDACFISV